MRACAFGRRSMEVPATKERNSEPVPVEAVGLDDEVVPVAVRSMVISGSGAGRLLYPATGEPQNR